MREFYIVEWVPDGTLMFSGSKSECENFLARYKVRDQRLMRILRGGT